MFDILVDNATIATIIGAFFAMLGLLGVTFKKFDRILNSAKELMDALKVLVAILKIKSPTPEMIEEFLKEFDEFLQSLKNDPPDLKKIKTNAFLRNFQK